MFPALQLMPLGWVILEWIPRFVLTAVHHIVLHNDGFTQDCSNSIANVLELLHACNKPQGYKPTPQSRENYERVHTPKSTRVYVPHIANILSNT